MRRAKALLGLDVALLLAFVLLQEPRPTGIPVHEWLGVGLTLLLVVHLLVNWRWITRTLGRLREDRRRARVNAALNGALYVVMLAALATGFAISEVVVPLSGLATSTMIAWYKAHSFFSGLTLVIVGLHLGLNWDWMGNVLRKWRLGRRGTGERSVAQQLDLDAPAAVAGRMLRLLAVSALLCGGLYLLVEGQSGATVRRRERHHAPPMSRAVADTALELGLVLATAVVGRRVLRLKL